MANESRLVETVTLSQARSLIRCLAHRQSLLLLSPPGVGKSDSVMQAAAEAGLQCRSLLGTQIAPEDVSGIPRIVGERSVFCPPRVLLPENPEPFCLFLDELPACNPDIQKAFYSLLLERRLGEHSLSPGTWVVAAGNRAEDRALVRSLSSALVNRVCILNIRLDVHEWLRWGQANGIRSDVLAFITFQPDALMRPVPKDPIPFSTPRSWALVSQAIDLADESGLLTHELRRALVFGRVSPEDAAIFCVMSDTNITQMPDVEACLLNPELVPREPSNRWFLIHRIRQMVETGTLPFVGVDALNHFLRSLTQEFRFALLVDLVPRWGHLGAKPAMLDTLKEVTGL